MLVMASKVFIYECIASSSTVNECIGVDFLVTMGEEIGNDKMLSIHGSFFNDYILNCYT
jgi:hypothetical protein